MDLLIHLLVIVLVLGVLFWVLQLIPLPHPWKTIALVIAALIAVLYLLRMLGMVTVPL